MASKKLQKKIRVVELFAGVGGFRLGLEGWNGKSPSSGYQDLWDSPFQVVWSNQFEPSTKTQHASQVYTKNFGHERHNPQNVCEIPADKIPPHDLLVGGFPCQDYSVARTLNHAKGLHGKKGVLWWEIHRIVASRKPKFLFLENVDRLLVSPASQRGRDFAIMLASLSLLGYVVEWRVINAADYGMPQRRRRVFILAYRKGTSIHSDFSAEFSPEKWIAKNGLFAKAFPVRVDKSQNLLAFKLESQLDLLSRNFNSNDKPDQISLFRVDGYSRPSGRRSPFANSGVMSDLEVYTVGTKPNYRDKRITLGDIVMTNGSVPDEYKLKAAELDRWVYLKGAKSEKRRNRATGFEYIYKEGALSFPDPLNKPSRTIITGEGGKTPSRFKHVIHDKRNGLRRLTPVELERLNMFPDNHTEGVSDTKRAFFMGNALVVGVVERISREIARRLSR